MSLFGGKRLIWIEPATKDIEEGVVALLDGADDRKPGGRDCRRAAQELGAAQARGSFARGAGLCVLRARRRRTPSGW